MAEPSGSRRESASPNGSSEEGDAADLREELTRSREEILHLRDRLIGADAELAAARARLAELEGRPARRLAGLAARIRGRLVGLVWKALAGLRDLRRPRA